MCDNACGNIDAVCERGSVIRLEMDMIEAGGRPREWVDGSKDGLFRYHPKLDRGGMKLLNPPINKRT